VTRMPRPRRRKKAHEKEETRRFDTFDATEKMPKSWIRLFVFRVFESRTLKFD